MQNGCPGFAAGPGGPVVFCMQLDCPIYQGIVGDTCLSAVCDPCPDVHPTGKCSVGCRLQAAVCASWLAVTTLAKFGKICVTLQVQNTAVSILRQAGCRHTCSNCSNARLLRCQRSSCCSTCQCSAAVYLSTGFNSDPPNVSGW